MFPGSPLKSSIVLQLLSFVGYNGFTIFFKIFISRLLPLLSFIVTINPLGIQLTTRASMKGRSILTWTSMFVRKSKPISYIFFSFAWMNNLSISSPSVISVLVFNLSSLSLDQSTYTIKFKKRLSKLLDQLKLLLRSNIQLVRLVLRIVFPFFTLFFVYENPI